MAKTYERSEREWLNKEKDMRAYSIVNIDSYQRSSGLTMNWRLADCSKEIALDFGIWFANRHNPNKQGLKETAKQYKDKKAKIDTLKKHLGIIESELDSWYKDFETKFYAEAVVKAAEEAKKPKVKRSVELTSLDELLEN